MKSSAINLNAIILDFHKELSLFDQQEDKSTYLGNRITGCIRFFFFQAREQNFKTCYRNVLRRFPKWKLQHQACLTPWLCQEVAWLHINSGKTRKTWSNHPSKGGKPVGVGRSTFKLMFLPHCHLAKKHKQEDITILRYWWHLQLPEAR